MSCRHCFCARGLGFAVGCECGARSQRAASSCCCPRPHSLLTQTGGFNAEADEELEDEQGNVYNKKTYEDLRRQGLI